MASQPHLKIFNPSQITNNKEARFPLFSTLPKELRLHIWRLSLQRERIIRVHLRSRAEPVAYQTAERPPPANHGERYYATVGGYQVLSKLLRVTSESRQAALEFYRVHLPCGLTVEPIGEGKPKPGTLYFNPEYDFLQIRSGCPANDTLVNFLYHLKYTFDPRRVGLLNLAMSTNDLNANDLHQLEPSELDSGIKQAFLETLAQLHDVFFVSTPRAGRQILGPLSGILTSETILNRSLPIKAWAPTFERRNRDPRPIAEDLKHVFVGTSDPRTMLHSWRRLLKKWNVSPPYIEYRFLLTFHPSLSQPRMVSDRESAQTWLEKDDARWRDLFEDDSADSTNPFASYFKKKNLDWPWGPKLEKFKNEDLEKAVKPAFGFWLFPVNALGAFPEEGLSEDEGFRPKTKQLLDLTQYWPELALSSLP